MKISSLDDEERARAFNIIGTMRLGSITQHSSLYELLDAIYNKHLDTKQAIHDIKEIIKNAN